MKVTKTFVSCDIKALCELVKFHEHFGSRVTLSLSNGDGEAVADVTLTMTDPELFEVSEVYATNMYCISIGMPTRSDEEMNVKFGFIPMNSVKEIR